MAPKRAWVPQEREPFFNALEKEVITAELAGKSVIVIADFNSKLGPEYVPNDPHLQDRNGALLAGIVGRQKLIVGNGLMKCKGIITRKRVTTFRTEESAISFVLFSEDLVDLVEAIKIDEKREHVLTRMSKTKGGIKTVESDHNIIETQFKLPWSKKRKPNLENIFNIKNKLCQQKFKHATSTNTYLSEVFDNIKDLDKATETFMKRLNKVIHKCFRKVGQKKKNENIKHEHMYNRWKLLRTKDDTQSKHEVKEIEAELAETYFKKISDATSDINCDEGGMSSGKLWNLKKQLFPRSRDPPTAMLDNSDNLVTNVETIKKLAVEAYKERLKSRQMKEGMEDVREAKERLTKQVLETAANNKTPPWNI